MDSSHEEFAACFAQDMNDGCMVAEVGWGQDHVSVHCSDNEGLSDAGERNAGL